MEQPEILRALKAQADAMEGLADGHKELRAELIAIAQKMGTVPSGGYGPAADSAGELAELIAKSDRLKHFNPGWVSGSPAHIDIPVPSRLLFRKTQIINATGQNQPLVPADRRPGIVFSPEQRLLVQGLFARFPTGSNLIEFCQEASYTNNARPQGDASPGGIEGEAFAESAMSFTLATSPVVTIGHWIPASYQVLSDSQALQPHLSERLLYGLNLEIEEQIITSTGSAGQLNGLTNQATAFSAGVTNQNAIDTLAKAIEQLQRNNFEPSAIIMHPTDWLAIKLLKDSQNRYLVGDPAAAQPAALWGLPVVQTVSMTLGRFLVIDSMRWGYIADREEATIRISDSHANFFVQGMVAILARARLAFVSERTTAAVYGQLSHAG